MVENRIDVHTSSILQNDLPMTNARVRCIYPADPSNAPTYTSRSTCAWLPILKAETYIHYPLLRLTSTTTIPTTPLPHHFYGTTSRWRHSYIPWRSTETTSWFYETKEHWNLKQRTPNYKQNFSNTSGRELYQLTIGRRTRTTSNGKDQRVSGLNKQDSGLWWAEQGWWQQSSWIARPP